MTAYYTYPEASTSDDTEQYMTVEEVAYRLGLPVGLVIRRVEAGDVPARQVETADGGTSWELRLADLGIEPDTLSGEHGSGYGYGEVAGVIEVAGTVEMSREALEAAIAETGIESETEAPGETGTEWSAEAVSEPAAETETRDDAGFTAEAAGEADADLDIEAMVPPPSRPGHAGHVTLIEAHSGPLEDIAGMSIDPRELVAGLLDRWERTLEQRIYAEQRQRFEAELVSRQSMVKELQMELRTIRAEHAAAQSEKELMLAERERKLADAERELESARRAASQAQIQLQAQQVQTRKRGWLFRR